MNIRLSGVLLLISMLISVHAFADRKSSSSGNSEHKRQIIQTIKQIEQAQKKLAKQFAKLNSQAKQDIISKTSGKIDSDSDLINDYLEGALKLNKCDSDSDDDGLDDGEEFENENDPKDDDSDDDGIKDGLEFEVKGSIQTVDSSSLLLGGVTYILNSSTVFYDDDKNLVTYSFFKAGDCVEVEGHVQGADKIVKKVKQEDDCS